MPYLTDDEVGLAPSSGLQSPAQIQPKTLLSDDQVGFNTAAQLPSNFQIPIKANPLSGMVAGINRKDASQAALGQPFSEVQPTGSVSQRAVTANPEANQEELAKATKQLVNYQIPINKTDSKVDAAGKEAVNLLMGIPEFLTSPAGLASIPFGAAVPRTAASLFGADAIKNAGQSVISAHSNWNELSPAEKTKAVVDIAGNIGFAGLLGHGVSEASGLRAPFTRIFESTPTRNAKDLAFAVNKAPLKASAALVNPIVQPALQPSPDAFQQPPAPEPVPTAVAANNPNAKVLPIAKPTVTGEAPVNQAALEVRRLGLRNIPDIQAQFPNAKLNREQARALRNEAFPSEFPPSTPPVEPAPDVKLTPQDLTPALLVDGKPITGGATHREIFDNIKDPELKDKALDSLVDDSKHVFVDPQGKVLSRTEASKSLGVTEPLHSEKLNELKASKPAEEMVTLYRAESPTVKFNDVFDADKLKDFKYDKEGQSWTDDLKFADYMRESYGKDAVIKKITIPKSEAEKHRVSGFEYKIPKPEQIAPVEPPAPPKPAPVPRPAEPVPTDTTGIAHRVSEARGVAAERGVGTSPEELVQKGREDLAKGADPEKILTDFNADPNHAISDTGMGVLRARQEQLAKAADRVADEKGINSPEYAAARKLDADFIARVKPYQSQWAEIGRGQQGETELDTGSFTAMSREFEAQAKKPPTPVQTKKLKQFADDSRKADKETQDAIKTVLDTVEKETPEPKVKTIAARVYEALDTQSKAALARLNARRAATSSGLAPQDLADYAILGATQIAKGIIKFPEWSKAMLDAFGDVIKPHLDRIYDAAREHHLAEIRNQFGEVKKGQPFTPDQVKTLWKFAKDNYITEGEVNFAKIANWLATDFGLAKKEVARALTQSPATRKALDAAYVKQYRARQLKNAAKQYLKQEATPSLVRKVQAIPRGLFNLAVFGHGTTWIGTHAGQLLYDPTQFKSIGENYRKMWRVAYSPKEWEKESQELVSRPNWALARRAGLNNDPYVRQGDYDTPELTAWMKALGVGKRGALGLLALRQDYFDTVWDNLPPTERTKEMAKYVVDLTNHATGTTRVKVVENPWTSLFLFAPRLVASRFQWDVTDPMKAALIKGFGLLGKKPTPEERMFANHVIKKRAIFAATILSSLGLNQIMLNATGSKQEVNFFHPHKSDWLRFKGFGMEAAPFSAGISVLRLLIQEYADFFQDHGKKRGLPFNPAEQAGTDALRYVRTELSPAASHGLDLMAQSDYAGRPLPALPFRNPPPAEPSYMRKEGIKPYTWPEYAATAAPIPFEAAIQEGFQTSGMDETAAQKWTKVLLGAAAMAATGVMVKKDPTPPKSVFSE